MKRIVTFAGKTLAGALSLMMASFALCMALGAQPAHAAVNFGTVTVSLPASASVVSGQSVSVACTISPYSHEQTPNCTTDYCPTGCDFASGGCLNAAGQCTCFGSTYSTYYSSGSTTSSNPSVARATYSNGTLSVTGYSPGTATITVYGSLRLWTTGTGNMTVTVTQPAQQAPSDTGSSSQPSSGSSAGSGSGSSSVSVGSAGGSSIGSVSVGSAGVSATSSTAQVLSAIVSSEGQASVEEGAEAEQGEVRLAAIGEADLGQELAALAGTNDTLGFWAGDDVEAPDYLWTFYGQDVGEDAAAAAQGFDMTITDVTGDDEELDARMGGRSYVAFSFAQEGAFPAPATISYHVDQVFANGERLTLYYLDPEARSLVAVQENVEVSEGYATAKMDHGGVWVYVADADLAGSLAQGDADESDAADEAAASETSAQEGFPVAAVVVAAVVVVAVVAVIAVALARRKKAGEQVSTEGAAEDGVSGVGLDRADALGAADSPDAAQTQVIAGDEPESKE